MSAVPPETIAMVHTGDDTHPATNATCEAVSVAQAAYLETLGWTVAPPPPVDEVPMIADTAAGLEHDTAALEQLAGLDPADIARLAELATATPDRDAPSRSSRTRGQTPEEG